MLLEELIKEEREEARQQGLDEGRKLGLEEGRISSVLILLSKLGKISEDIRKMVEEETDPEVLNTYLIQASKAKSMDEFRQFLSTRKEK